MHLHVHICLGGHDHEARDEVKLGDGQAAKRLLELALKWGPVIALLFGVKLPPLPVDERQTVPSE